MELIAETLAQSTWLRAWRLAVASLGMLFFLASFAPTYALSGISLNPTSVPTGGTVTITITQVVGPLPDVFGSIKVTDPLGNVFAYTGTPITVTHGSPVTLTFPDPGQWTPAGGYATNPGGTDVPGTYMVEGAYLDTSLSVLLGHFVVLHDSGSFGVPEFNQSVLLLAGAMVPALLLVRRSARPPV
jgi:hypothetical protein